MRSAADGAIAMYASWKVAAMQAARKLDAFRSWVWLGGRVALRRVSVTHTHAQRLQPAPLRWGADVVASCACEISVCLYLSMSYDAHSIGVKALQ